MPYFAENYAIYSNPLYPGYIAIYSNPLYPGYIAKGNKNVIPPSPPEIEVISPRNGEYVKGMIEIKYKISKNVEESIAEYIVENNSFLLNKSKKTEVSFF